VQPTTSRRVALASDHAGVALKDALKQAVEALGHTVLDLGTHTDASVDYPDYGDRLARTILAGEAEVGVAICGTGIGISIAANRHKGVRAALCHDATSARLSRQHNDANVLALGARVIGAEVAKDCLATFLATEFEGGGRHTGRVNKLG
jgi:ribose 5-phosphate isomerase B